MPVATYTVADASSAQIAIAFKWRVIAPTDVTAAPTSDFAGNAYPSGTGAIAANASPRQAAFQIETLPNTAVTTDRSFDVEIYDVTPAGTTLTVSKVRTKIVEDDVSSGGGGGGTTPSTMTYVYGPNDNAADSGTQTIGSRLQQCGRTWRSGAQAWKVTLGQTADGNGRTGLFILFNDGAGQLVYFPTINTQNINGRSVTVPYTGAAPSATEPYTYVRINADYSIDYCCAATAPTTSKPKPDNERILVTISKGIWDDPVFWGSQVVADLVPSTYAMSNADSAPANGIYAARLGAVQ